MQFAPIARLAVPTGTAAAAVVMREPTGDPTTEGRRFAAIAALDDEGFRGNFEELIVSGVYTVLSDRILVLRITGGGTRAFAAAVCITGNAPPAPTRAGLAPHTATLGTPSDSDATAALRALLEAETKQRPIFHGMTAEGITYSGFEAQSPAPILAQLAQALPAGTPTASAAVALAFAGDAIEVPAGLVVSVGSATV